MTTKTIYENLDQIEDLRANRFKHGEHSFFKDDPYKLDVEQILWRKDPKFRFLNAYKYDSDDKVVGYEPSVPQFFEHYLPKIGIALDKFYLLSSQHLEKHMYIDYTLPSDQRKQIMEIGGKTCVMNLGVTAKAMEKTLDGITFNEEREASGIWKDKNTLQAFRQDLKSFFISGTEQLRFVIDASSVCNEIFNLPETMILVTIASSEWDSADKYKDAKDVPNRFVSTKSSFAFERVLYGIENIEIEKKPSGFIGKINGEDKTDEVKDVPGIVKLLNENGTLDNFKHYFDVKRSGDAFQVLEVDELNKSAINAHKYVLVTNDHLAFLKARIINIPVVFTKSKRLICVNNEMKNTTQYVQQLSSVLEQEVNVVKTAKLLDNEVTDKVLSNMTKLKRELALLVDKYMDLISLKNTGDGKFRHKLDELLVHSLDENQKGIVDNFIDIEGTQLKSVLYIYSDQIASSLAEFASSFIDLQARLNLMKKCAAIANDLVVEATNVMQDEYPDDNSHLNALVGEIQKFSLLRNVGYGVELYTLFQDEDKVQNEIERIKTLYNEITQENVDFKYLEKLVVNDFHNDKSQGLLCYEHIEAKKTILNFVRKEFHIFLANPFHEHRSRTSRANKQSSVPFEDYFNEYLRRRNLKNAELQSLQGFDMDVAMILGDEFMDVVLGLSRYSSFNARLYAFKDYVELISKKQHGGDKRSRRYSLDMTASTISKHRRHHKKQQLALVQHNENNENNENNKHAHKRRKSYIDWIWNVGSRKREKTDELHATTRGPAQNNATPMNIDIDTRFLQHIPLEGLVFMLAVYKYNEATSFATDYNTLLKIVKGKTYVNDFESYFNYHLGRRHSKPVNSQKHALPPKPTQSVDDVYAYVNLFPSKATMIPAMKGDQLYNMLGGFVATNNSSLTTMLAIAGLYCIVNALATQYCIRYGHGMRMRSLYAIVVLSVNTFLFGVFTCMWDDTAVLYVNAICYFFFIALMLEKPLQPTI